MLRRFKGPLRCLGCLKTFEMYLLSAGMIYSVLLCSLADIPTNAHRVTDRETFANLKLLSELKTISWTIFYSVGTGQPEKLFKRETFSKYTMPKYFVLYCVLWVK